MQEAFRLLAERGGVLRGQCLRYALAGFEGQIKAVDSA